MNMLFALVLSVMSSMALLVLLFFFAHLIYGEERLPNSTKKGLLVCALCAFLLMFYSALRAYGPNVELTAAPKFYPPSIREVPKAPPLVEEVDRSEIFDGKLTGAVMPE
jgi:hypothetical protein